MRIVTVGAGYVGLATAVGFARHGHEVRVIEIDRERTDQLRSGHLPFYDPTLEPGLQATIDESLTVSDWDAADLADFDIAFVCVNTPPTASGALDVGAVRECATQLAEMSNGAAPIVVRSTVNAGTSAEIEAELRERWPRAAVLANPEFLREGLALEDFDHPDRRVIGGSDARAMRMLAELYAFSEARPIETDATTAELIKLASNAALAVRVSFANEVAALAVAHGADPETTLAAVGADARIGPRYLQPGLGFGGLCLPKDLDALRAGAHEHDTTSAVLDATARTNTEALETLATQVAAEVPERGSVCVVGLAFKPGSESVRGSRALELVRALLDRGLAVAVFEPIAEADARAVLGAAVEYVCEPAELAVFDAVVVAQATAGVDLESVPAALAFDTLGRVRRVPAGEAVRSA